MKIYLSFIFSVFHFICFAQLDWSLNEKFNGPIKSVSSIYYSFGYQISFPAIDSNSNYSDIRTDVIFFDKVKNPIKFIKLNKEKDTFGYCLWVYNNSGRLYKRIDYGKNNILSQTLEYSYEKNGIIKEKLYLPHKGLFTTWITQIDSINLIKRYYEIINGKIDDNYITQLNDSFLPIITFEIDSKGDRKKTSEYKYNNKNQEISCRYFTNDSSSYQPYEYRYDKQGNRIESKEFDKTGKMVKLEIQQFDRFGNPVRKLIYDPNQIDYPTSILRIDYTYDEYGNWISQKTYLENELFEDIQTSKVYRRIEYY